MDLGQLVGHLWTLDNIWTAYEHWQPIVLNFERSFKDSLACRQSRADYTVDSLVTACKQLGGQQREN